MKKFVFLGLIICCVSCFNNHQNTTVELSDEVVLFNMTIDSLNEKGVITNVFGQFNFSVKEPVLKEVFQFIDSTLTVDEIDSLCAGYYYHCSTSIHELINEKNKRLIVYRFPKENVSVLGYPIIIGKNKAVTINYYHKYIRSHVYELHPVALVFEKKDAVWNILSVIVLHIEE